MPTEQKKIDIDFTDGIFNVVISVCGFLAISIGEEEARRYVASYLIDLANDLINIETKKVDKIND